MIINGRFYYNIASSEIQYGLRPSDKLNVTRLLSGLPAWEKPAGAALKKKTLIVNASDLCTIKPIEHQIIIKERLEVLAQQGFDLHVFYHNNLHPWSAVKRVNLINDGMHIQAGDAAQTLGLSADELLILDRNILAELVKGDDEDWEPYRHLTKIRLHQSNLSADSLTRLLEARQGEMRELTISECLNLEGFSPPS